jgi:hypothetical protein
MNPYVGANNIRPFCCRWEFVCTPFFAQWGENVGAPLVGALSASVEFWLFGGPGRLPGCKGFN